MSKPESHPTFTPSEAFPTEEDLRKYEDNMRSLLGAALKAQTTTKGPIQDIAQFFAGAFLFTIGASLICIAGVVVFMVLR